MTARAPDGSGKPRLLIDVDGVINAFGRPKGSRRRVVGPYELAVPRGTIGRLRRMIRPFDPIWATTWAEHAPAYISPLIGGVGAGWDHIAFPYETTDPRVRRTWKLAGLLTWAELDENAERPLVWVDDDLDEDAFEWAAARALSGVPTALVKTDGIHGLTDREVTIALEFARSLGI
ncbi:MAG: HAD domain-containing protein [Actinomycetota bacterium]